MILAKAGDLLEGALGISSKGALGSPKRKALGAWGSLGIPKGKNREPKDPKRERIGTPRDPCEGGPWGSPRREPWGVQEGAGGSGGPWRKFGR